MEVVNAVCVSTAKEEVIEADQRDTRESVLQVSDEVSHPHVVKGSFCVEKNEKIFTAI